MTTFFDEAVPRALEVTREQLGADVDVTIVRDTVGCISVVVPTGLPNEKLEACASKLDVALGAYSPGVASVILAQSDLLVAEDVMNSPDRVQLDDAHAFLIDRLLTNQDWVRPQLKTDIDVPLATGFSVKGGVGRTTALAVWARHLANIGKHIVLVDLDLEAPGLAATLLQELPSYGIVDWLAEDLVGQADKLDVEDILANSPVADQMTGTVRVLPAFGVKTENYVSKLGRVLVPTVRTDGSQQEFAVRLSTLLKQVSKAGAVDAILIDARAGLHDLGAAAVTQLGAEVFFFARDEHSGWDAWKQLFKQLRRSTMVKFGGPDDDLRWRLKMVGAQVGPHTTDRDRLVDRSYELWTTLYDESEGASADPLTFVRSDAAGPHYPLTILFDTQLRGMSLVGSNNQIEPRLLEVAFDEFCRGATSALFDR